MAKKDENLFDDYDEEEIEPTPEPAPEPVNAELEDLREFKAVALAAQREGDIGDAFEKAGYTRKLAALYIALHPGDEATAEDVKAFADEYEVTPTRPVGYTPRAISSEPTVTPARTYSRAEMEEIAKQNPARARALADAGRVRWNNPEQIGGPR